MSDTPLRAAVLEALRHVQDPDRRRDIVSLNMVSGLEIKNGHVGFAIEVDPKRGASLEPLRKAAERAVDAVPGVLSVSAVLTAERQAGGAAAAPPRGPAGGKHVLPGVRSIIAIASGKGGVGKSTTATNLALAFAAKGLRTAILDADIYGPSQPRLLGLSGKPQSPDGRTLTPMQNHGVKVMSIGFLVPEDTPMIWRGPMVMGALEQLIRDVAWGETDIMVIDMPPGTGDAQLTISQRVALTGAVIVSTPQDIALIDARKGLNMFRKVDVPVLGIIENMSYYQCPNCGHRAEIFSHGGAHREADKRGTEFLGEIPLDIAIRETSDGGTPIVASQPDSPHAQAYRSIADRLWVKVEATLLASAAKAPRIVVQ
jgi:ATP-binding protein involved in chromosome partitioning